MVHNPQNQWRISGKGRAKVGTVNHLSTYDRHASSYEDIANAFANAFSKTSSTELYTETFQLHKKQAEKTKLKFKSNKKEIYNKLFSFKDLK